MKLKQLFAILISFVLAGNLLFADVARDANGKPLYENKIQKPAKGVFDNRSNAVSNLELYLTNYGMFGLNVAFGDGTGVWPRGSKNHYIFGGGVWFAAQKNRPGTNEKANFVEVTYDPNRGTSWMVPGRISDGPLVDNSAAAKYRIYFSTEFNPSDGKPFLESDGPAWPLWDSSEDPDAKISVDRYFGNYIGETGNRNTATYPKGPAFISGEDIYSTFKDTDLSRFEGGEAIRRQLGYPLGLQFEQTTYSWGFGDYKDLVFMAYNITNTSPDTLENCWMAPVLDIDLAIESALSQGARNDRVRFYDEDPSLNMAFQWTEPDEGERGQGFGYLGFTFLESPAVWRYFDTTWVLDTDGNPVLDQNGDPKFELSNEIIKENTNFIRKDKPWYPLKEQLGLVTFRNWPIDKDVKEDDPRYLFMSSAAHDGDDGPGDKRFMMATGPFHLLPMDTVRIVFGMILSNTTKGGEADGTKEDAADLVRKVKFAREVYNDDFAAPRPPNRSLFTKVEGLNNAVRVSWDSSAEVSRDPFDSGMDFLGYRLYRSRDKDLDTINVNSIGGNTTENGIQYNKPRGPLGWKQIAEYSMLPPFRKSYLKVGNQLDRNNPFIDSLRIIGPMLDDKNNIIDSMAIRVMKVATGVNLYSDFEVVGRLGLDPTFKADNFGKVVPIVASFDTSYFSQPWGPYFKSLNNFTKEVVLTSGSGGTTQYFHYPYINYKVNEYTHLMDSVMAGVAYINRALMKFNPLLYERKTINIPDTNTVAIPADGLIYLKINDVVTQTVDTAFVMDTYQTATINGVKTAIIDAYVPYPKNKWMTDTLQVRRSLNDLYELIQESKIAELDFPGFANDSLTISNVIVPHMTKITNGRTFVDIGDDDRSGVINYDEDPTKTEKLLNNVPYYYKILAYDEGDFTQPTPSRLNDAEEGLVNFTEAYPAAPRAENRVEFKVVSVDENIGGLYNFSFYAIEPERAMQLFGGDTLELEFQPVWSESEMRFLGRGEEGSKFGLYRRRMTLTDITKDKLLFDGVTFLEEQPGIFNFRGAFTENAFSYVLSDTVVVDTIANKEITFGTPFNKDIIARSGNFTSGNFKDPTYAYTRAMLPPAYGTLGFDFDFTIQQFGGNFRGDSVNYTEAKFANGGTEPTTGANTPINYKSSQLGRDPDIILTTQKVGDTFYQKTSNISTTSFQPIYGSFNNGPGNYLVEFLPGGEELMNIQWGPDGKKETKRFRVSYLELKIDNKISYTRPDPENGPDATEVVAYREPLAHMSIDTVPDYNTYSTLNRYTTFDYPKRMYPDPRNLVYHGINTNEFIGKFNIAAYGWVDSRNVSNIKLGATVARPAEGKLKDETNTFLGQGKYYLSAVSEDGLNTIDFTHALNISGVIFGLDYANRGGRWYGVTEWEKQENYTFGTDFVAGDKIMLKTFGGALGLPMPGAKVKVVVSKTMEDGEKYTDKLLDQIQVVPNPYYISHQGQRSPYDAKLYFTRLPVKCTIDIYTITGDLVVSIQHDENASIDKDKYALNVWDLLTKNGQRIASQTLAAVISTPDGAQTIKNFSVVVGGFRLLPD